MGGKVYDDLVEGIRERRVLVVVGAGVAVQATGNEPVASWIGLLQNGVARVADLDPTLANGWKKRQTEVLDAVAAGTADIKDLLGVAQQVSSRLGWPDDPEWVQWLRETVGALTPTAAGRRVLEAIDALDVPIATTNYDGLLKKVTGLPPVTWTERGAVVNLLQGKEKGILHLHGFWNKPDSVILGINSYDALIGDGTAQRLETVLPTLFSLLYVGCGDGLADPNFAALRAWIREILPGTEHRHVRLARECEVAALQKEHPREERTFVRAYGANFDDLAPYLEKLACDAGRAPATGRSQTPAARRLKLTEIPEQCSYADDRYASCYIHTPQGTPEDRLEVKFGATFGRRPALDAPPLTRVETEVTMPKGRGADRMLGGGVAHRCADGPSIRLCRAKAGVRCWEIIAADGQSLHDHNAEADTPPLFDLLAAAAGDVLTLRMTAYPNKAFFDGPWVPYAVPEGDKAQKMRKRIIDRLRVTPLGEPDAQGGIVLCETTNIVEEQG